MHTLRHLFHHLLRYTAQQTTLQSIQQGRTSEERDLEANVNCQPTEIKIIIIICRQLMLIFSHEPSPPFPNRPLQLNYVSGGFAKQKWITYFLHTQCWSRIVRVATSIHVLELIWDRPLTLMVFIKVNAWARDAMFKRSVSVVILFHRQWALIRIIILYLLGIRFRCRKVTNGR